MLYPGFPCMFPTWANMQVLSRAIANADIIVCPDDNNIPMLAWLARLHDKPMLSNVHTNVAEVLRLAPSLLLNSFAAPMIAHFVRICSHVSTATYTTSPSYREVLQSQGCRVDGVFSPRIKLAVFTLPDSDEEIAKARKWLTNNQPNKKVLLVAGRMSHEKRIPLLAQAKPEGVVLCVVGDGPDKAPIVALANDYPDVVVHVGMVNQDRLRVLYKACDLLVSASAFETLGMTVAEAHMCGCPVAVQAAPGFVSQVIPGRNGYLINYDNASEAREQLRSALANRPSKEQVLGTLAERWDAKLEDLQDVVVRLARDGRAPMDFTMKCFLSLGMLVYWFLYTVISFPFNTLSSRVRSIDFPMPNINVLYMPGSQHGMSGRVVLFVVMLYAAKLDGALGGTF
jgi:glycosyltransferase involved in cell wall biosynthesis